jgi:hypothetical protein
MLREANIPFLLWLPAALVFHLVTGSGAVEAANVLSERADILAFARSVRSDVRESLLMTIEFGVGVGEEEAEETKDDDGTAKSDDEPSDEEVEEETPVVEKVKPKAPTAERKAPAPLPPAPPKKEPEKVALTPSPPPPEKKEPAKKEPEPDKKEPEPDKKEAQTLTLPKPDGRIAVINDPSLAKDQPDNENARRIADYANTVQEETMARFRSYDQNTSKPTGGGEPTPIPMEQSGNNLQDERGFSNQVEADGDPRQGSKGGPSEQEQVAIARSQQGKNVPNAAKDGVKAVKGAAGRAEHTGPLASEALSSNESGDAAGSWSISADAEGDGKAAQKGRKGRKAIAGSAAIPGVPMPGALPQQYSINAYGLVEALGAQHLRQEQQKARNTRLARHRGSFKANEFQEYRAAIENYDPSVKAGNQSSLNAARVPFAGYINMMHNRIHPIFADSFLGSLGKLSADDRLSDLKLTTHMELVLDGQSGNVVRAGIVRGSGVTAFDVAALSSAKSAGPFGQPPEAIVSPDGNVYVHWEFYRDPYYACTSKFARPYLIKSAPKPDDDGPGPRRPPGGGGEERKTARALPSEGAGPLRPEAPREQ